MNWGHIVEVGCGLGPCGSDRPWPEAEYAHIYYFLGRGRLIVIIGFGYEFECQNSYDCCFFQEAQCNVIKELLRIRIRLPSSVGPTT
jgi:hypothetical protein